MSSTSHCHQARTDHGINSTDRSAHGIFVVMTLSWNILLLNHETTSGLFFMAVSPSISLELLLANCFGGSDCFHSGRGSINGAWGFKTRCSGVSWAMAHRRSRCDPMAGNPGLSSPADWPLPLVWLGGSCAGHPFDITLLCGPSHPWTVLGNRRGTDWRILSCFHLRPMAPPVMVDSNLGHLSLSRDWQCSGLTRCCIETLKIEKLLPRRSGPPPPEARMPGSARRRFRAAWM